jgi:hypothetical protein
MNSGKVRLQGFNPRELGTSLFKIPHPQCETSSFTPIKKTGGITVLYILISMFFCVGDRIKDFKLMGISMPKFNPTGCAFHCCNNTCTQSRWLSIEFYHY